MAAEKTKRSEDKTRLDPLPVSKVQALLGDYEKQKSQNKNIPAPVVVFLSGSFNPLHKMHLQVLDACRESLEKLGFYVAGGYIAPSSDEYVRGKLQQDAISLVHRNAMVHIATKDSDWLDVCPWGIAYGGKVRDLIEEILRETFPKTPVDVLEVCGADHGMKGRGVRQKRMLCIGRHGYTEQLKEALQKEGVDPKRFVLVDIELQDISSTKIRQRFSEGKGDSLVADGWMSEQLVQYMIKHNLFQRNLSPENKQQRVRKSSKNEKEKPERGPETQDTVNENQAD